MQAFILAAGLGTRLREWTRSGPKALVTVGGVPMLEHVVGRLVDAGSDRIVINTHHFADQIVEYVRSRKAFGVEVVFSYERERPLETGGGLSHAAHLFRDRDPIILHNVDILSDVPLRDLVAVHECCEALATLAVMRRESSRYLLFDDAGLLGRVDKGKGLDLRTRPEHGEVRPFAFAGIHVLDPRILKMITESGAFSILDTYLRLAGGGQRILPFDVTGVKWIDIGTPEKLVQANQWLERDLP